MKRSMYIRAGIVAMLMMAVFFGFSQNKKVREAQSENGLAHCYTIDYTFASLEGTLFYQDFLQQYFTEKKFVLKNTIESPAAIHLHFEQQYDGLPIFHATLQLNISKNKKLISVVDNTADTKRWSSVYGADLANLCPYPQELILTNEDMIFVIDNNPFYAKRYVVKTKPIQKEVIVADNTVAYERQLGAFFTTDSTVSVKVFNPDPITSANGVYGGSLSDNNDATNSTLDALRATKTINARFIDSIFYLTNNNFVFNDVDNNGVNPPTSRTPVFDFKRNQTSFEYVNTYYHIQTMREYMNSLGFGIGNSLVRVDPHGTADDNSFFQDPDQLIFGTGGIDDAEDADVIVHEFSHFLSNVASPGTNWGSQRSAIDEAYGDYFATSYSRSINDHNWQKMFSWDGNLTWNGRIVQGSKRYPADVSGNIYNTSLIISQCLNAIWTDIGREATDSIFLQSMYLTGSNASLLDYAQNLLDADNLLTGGRYQCPIFERLLERGLVSGTLAGCNVGITEQHNTLPFSLFSAQGGFIIHTDMKAYALSVYDINGGKIVSGKNIPFVDMQSFSKGIYIVAIENEGKVFYTKYSNH